MLDAMLPNDLDLSGWELRKALRLFSKSNAALFEWLDSPIVYRANSAFHAETKALIAQYFNPVSVYHHYLSIAKRKADQLPDHMKIKQLFYVLRPLLACRWIRQAGTMPPTAFGTLLAAEWVEDAERTRFAALLAQKSLAKEGEVIPLSTELLDWLRDELANAHAAAAGIAPTARSSLDRLDAHFRLWVST